MYKFNSFTQKANEVLNLAIKAAEEYGYSWHYWAYGKTSGFQAYNQDAGEWFPEMKKVFDAYTSKPFPTL